MSVYDWLSWLPGLIALHAGSDAVTGLAYLSIPIAIASFMRRRRDVAYGWVAYLFIGFILACGATHLFSILTLWFPVYGIEGIVKSLTAVLSLATAVLLWRVIPRLLALPSAIELTRLNRNLSEAAHQHVHISAQLKQSEALVRQINAELEARVKSRTSELAAANDRLSKLTAALARSEAEFRASFEGAAVGKVLADPTSRGLVRANRAFANMLGYTPSELVGRTGTDMTVPDDQQEFDSQYARLLSGEVDTLVHEKRLVCHDGRHLWVRVSAAIRTTSEGNRLTIATVEDIDARHRAEAEKIQRLIKEKTAALEQRGLLLREVYHRVKNNLQMVDSLLAMQARKLDDAHAKQALLGLRHRVFALGLVHHQLMGSANLQTFNVSPFLHELVRNLVDGGGKRDIELVVDSSPLTVGLDFAIPLGMLVTELVTNSLKHAFPDGQGIVRVSLRRGDNAKVILTVSDDGRFAPLPVKEAHKSGIGMHIIKGLTAQMRATYATCFDRGTTTEIFMDFPETS
jgi:PAS domain S-box-containing protein